MTDYTITGIRDPQCIRSDALRSIAEQALSQTIDAFSIISAGEYLADAIVITEPEIPGTATIIIDGNGSPWYASIDTSHANTMTDDDYDDAINAWMLDDEIGFPNGIDAETPGGCPTP